LLALGTITATIAFGSSDALAGAYGIAVSLLMAITTLLATFVALHWKHSPFIVYAVNGGFLALDLAFFAATSTKIYDGGWFPLALSSVIAFLMLTWRKGEEMLDEVRLQVRQKPAQLLEEVKKNPPFRLPGTAVVLGRMAKGVPLALSQNLRHNRVLHERVYLVAVVTAETPRVAEEKRVEAIPIAEGLTRIVMRFGFMEQPDVPQGLAIGAAHGQIVEADLKNVSYYTGHETIIPSARMLGMSVWRETLFAFMHHNAQRPGAYFNIPSSQIVEIGIELEI